MEAAVSARFLPAQRRRAAFERECEHLRPLGEAYVLHRFGGSLNRADAEDAVAEVLIRLHRLVAEGRPPRNLRAVFFTSVRNAAIGQLRSRATRPTVALEAAAEAAVDPALPAERAEGREEAVRLQEALARMRPNYREAILLRFGFGFTVPEIAAHLGISLPAAKKRLLRATQQVRKRLASIEAEEFCPQMRQLVHRSLLEKEASGLASEAETRILHAHFEHCGSCRSFLMTLHDHLHELGSAALLGLGAADRVGGHLALLDRLSRLFGGAAHGAASSAERARHLVLRATAPLQSGDGAAGALLGSGQKLAAICTAGAGAATVTCLATGIVGPGIGLSIHPAAHQHATQAAAPAGQSSAAPFASHAVASTPASPSPPATAPSRRAPSPRSTGRSAAEQTKAEFGFESAAPSASSSSSAPASASSSSTSNSPPPPPSSSTSSSGSGGGTHSGTESFGFHG